MLDLFDVDMKERKKNILTIWGVVIYLFIWKLSVSTEKNETRQEIVYCDCPVQIMVKVTQIVFTWRYRIFDMLVAKLTIYF